MPILEGKGVTKYFGGLAAVSNVDFNVKQGEALGIIGPNGAGKTTLFNLISAALTTKSGTIRFKGENITGLKPYKICRMGLARTFQVYVASGDLTVEENVMVGCFMNTRSTTKARARAKEILRDLKLDGLSNALVSELPVAAQKRVTMTSRIPRGKKAIIIVQGCTNKFQETVEPINVVMSVLEIPIVERLIVPYVGLTEKDTVDKKEDVMIKAYEIGARVI